MTVYALSHSPDGPFKIGMTEWFPKRKNQLQTAHFVDFEYWCHIDTLGISDDLLADKESESLLHELFKDKNIKREWFDISISELTKGLEKIYKQCDFHICKASDKFWVHVEQNIIEET